MKSTLPSVPDLTTVDVPLGARVLVVSNLHLASAPTPSSSAAARELAQAVEAWSGPGVLVFNGSCLELLSTTAGDTGETAETGDTGDTGGSGARAAQASLAAHRALLDATAAFASAPGRRVLYLPGASDGRLVWDSDACAVTREHLHAEVALAAELRIDTGAGPRLVRVEPGHQLDAITRLGDPRNPADRPVGHHLVRRTWRSLAGVALRRAAAGGDDRLDRNAAPRARARELVTAGYAGYISGHTQRAELTHLGTGFYANCGAAAKVVAESSARLRRLRAPSIFLAERRIGWVELDAGAEMHVRLLHHRQNPSVVATWPHGASWPAPVSIDRRLRRVRRWSATLVAAAGVVSLVSAFLARPGGRLAIIREVVPLAVPQVADALVALASLGLLALARSIRRGQRRAWLVTEALLTGTFVLHLVKGIDVEEAVAIALVSGYLFVHRDAFRAEVDGPSTRRGLLALVGGGIVPVVAGTAAVEIGTRLARSRHYQRLPLPRAFLAASQRLFGFRGVALPDRLDDFFTPAMVAVAIGLGLAVTYLLFRPVVARRAWPAGVAGDSPALAGRAGGVGEGKLHAHVGGGGLARAREVVRRHGAGTLDYFALRPDKDFFFWGDGVVAYGVFGGVCLVSPDPIGPRAERDEVWHSFRRFADGQGWTLAVLGAGEEWLPVYRAAGMHDLYVGDEGVVDCSRFRLDGGRFKGLRQAVNRVAKYGYTITFHDPSTIDATLRAQLAAVMTKSRRGDVERGFSMTLGRAFDPNDQGLLLAVVWGPPSAGESDAAIPSEPVAFCQYVPAPGINGYSLDLMRRDAGTHPNGLLDFAIVETVRHLQAEGKTGLGLNFATMRAVLAGEAGDGISQRVQAWLLRRMSDSMQIESLWKFNAKFDPDWQPRYALYDAPEHALPCAIAVARAESFWELPVIGRFLVPSIPARPSAATNGSAAPSKAATG